MEKHKNIVKQILGKDIYSHSKHLFYNDRQKLKLMFFCKNCGRSYNIKHYVKGKDICEFCEAESK